MSFFKFSSSLSCLSCFNFFSKCFKSNKSQSEDQVLLLGKDNELSPHILDAQFLVELTPALPNNSPEQSPNNDSPRNVSPTPPYTSVQAYTPDIFPVSSSSSYSFELSPSIMPQISPKFTPVIAIEISESPPLIRRLPSGEDLITRRTIFTRPPVKNQVNESQITSNSSDVEIIDSELSLNTTKSIDDANLSTELSQNTTQSMFDPISPTSISDNKMSTSQILESRNFENTPSPKPLSPPSPNPNNINLSIDYQRKLSIPGSQKYFPGTENPLRERSSIVPISKEAQVARRIKTDEKGKVTCSF